MQMSSGESIINLLCHICRCEVSAEAPSFVTAEGEKELRVTGLLACFSAHMHDEQALRQGLMCLSFCGFLSKLISDKSN